MGLSPMLLDVVMKIDTRLKVGYCSINILLHKILIFSFILGTENHNVTYERAGRCSSNVNQGRIDLRRGKHKLGRIIRVLIPDVMIPGTHFAYPMSMYTNTALSVTHIVSTNVVVAVIRFAVPARLRLFG